MGIVSGRVSAGVTALATAFNNLRADLTSHDHTTTSGGATIDHAELADSGAMSGFDHGHADIETHITGVQTITDSPGGDQGVHGLGATIYPLGCAGVVVQTEGGAASRTGKIAVMLYGEYFSRSKDFDIYLTPYPWNIDSKPEAVVAVPARYSSLPTCRLHSVGQVTSRILTDQKGKVSWVAVGWGDGTEAAIAATSGVTYNGSFSASQMERYYYFDMPGTHTITVSLTDIPDGHNFNIILRDSNYVEIDSSSAYGDTAESISTTALPAGRYYVQVYHFSLGGSTGEYSLVITYA